MTPDIASRLLQVRAAQQCGGAGGAGITMYQRVTPDTLLRITVPFPAAPTGV